MKPGEPGAGWHHSYMSHASRRPTLPHVAAAPHKRHKMAFRAAL